uniref:Uncharacterized protein n=1 Tax=Parascaris univalens TaxID=6257 RepID=A0A915C387_PARUN
MTRKKLKLAPQNSSGGREIRSTHVASLMIPNSNAQLRELLLSNNKPHQLRIPQVSFPYTTFFFARKGRNEKSINLKCEDFATAVALNVTQLLPDLKLARTQTDVHIHMHSTDESAKTPKSTRTT